MKVEILPVGYLRENCYIISKNNNCIIIDPGDEDNKIIKCIGGKKVLAILITHYHFDHIGALNILKEKYNVEIYDYKNINEDIKISDFNFKVIDTKGHTDDSVSFYFYNDNIMFTGDFLFKESIGRFDFDNSSEIDMLKSIENIKKYDKSIKIYPGHGDITTLEYEFKNNPYLN